MVPRSSFQGERRLAGRFLASLPVETDRGPGITRDASASGLCLVTEQPLTVGYHLQLAMSAPDHAALLPLRLVLQRRVVRVEKAQAAVGADIALDEGSKELCSSFMESQETKLDLLPRSMDGTSGS
jgi:hypothetical protein